MAWNESLGAVLEAKLGFSPVDEPGIPPLAALLLLFADGWMAMVIAFYHEEKRFEEVGRIFATMKLGSAGLPDDDEEGSV